MDANESCWAIKNPQSLSASGFNVCFETFWYCSKPIFGLAGFEFNL
jgi:hypothetical protein